MTSDCSKVIVIEGPDGAGKSTLAQDLSDYFQWPIIHTGGPIRSRSEFLKKVVTYNLMSPEAPVIYDRIPYISDQIYAPIAGHKSATSGSELNYMLERIRPVIVYCALTDNESMSRRISIEHKEHKTYEHLNQIQANHNEIVQRYYQLFSNLHYSHVLHFNWMKDDIRNLMQEINRRVSDVWTNRDT